MSGLPAILHRIYQFSSEHLCCITIAPIPREREPRGITQPLAKLKITRSAAEPLLGCLGIFDSHILHVPAGDRNSERAQDLFRRSACWPSPNSDSGECALRISRHHTATIDVLVSDALMQPLSRFEVAAQIKAANPNAVVILTSGSPRSMFPDATMPHDFLDKLFCQNDILTAISRHSMTGIRGDERRT